MPRFTFNQLIRQLEKRKGGYYYLQVDAAIVNQLERKRATRIICTLNGTVTYGCGLNHLGDGNFYIIVAARYLKKLGLALNDPVTFEIEEDPNPFGVEVPKVLSILLEQDPDAKRIYDGLTDGKKRSLIYGIKDIKNVDKQVQKIRSILQQLNSQSR